MVNGRTHVRLEATYTDRRNGVFVGLPTGSGMASLFAAGIMASAGAAPIVMAAGCVLVAGLAGVGLLRLIRGVVRDEQANVAGTFEAVLSLAAEHAPKPAAWRPPRPRRRWSSATKRKRKTPKRMATSTPLP